MRYSLVERSRFWREVVFCDYHAPRQTTVKFLLDLAKRIGCKPVLMTLSDWAAIFIEKHADALEEGFTISRASSPIVERLANKWGMFELAQRHGIPTPRTVYPKTRAEVLNFLQSISMPVVMKTADAALPYIPQKAIIGTAGEAVAKWESDAAHGPPNLILQEFIPGDARNVWMCNAYFTNDSRCLAIFTGKKLRQISDTGVATLAVCEQNEQVAHLTKKFLCGVGYAGAVGIGYRYDARDGEYKLLDVNARLSGVFRLFRSPNGADTARVCYLDLTRQPTPQSTLAPGRKWLLEDDVLSAYRAVKSGKLSLRQWIAPIAGVRELHWFAADDPAPGFAWMRYSFVRPFADKAKAGWRKLTQRPVANEKPRQVSVTGADHT